MLQFLRLFGQRLGFVPRRKGKSVLVWAAGLDGFARLAPVLAELSRRNPRLSIYRIPPSPSVRRGLAAANSGSDILAPPVRFAPAIRLYLERAKAQLLIIADEPDQAAGALIGHAAARGLAVVGDEASAETLSRQGADPVKVLQFRAPDAESIAAVADALQPLIAAKRIPPGLAGTDGGARQGWAATVFASPLLAPVLRWKYRPIETLDRLSAALGRPETILCLGNGPSSEDPRLHELSYDALFRVNHFWQPRGVLTEPDVVFTGLRATIKAIRKPVIFAFQTREEERKLMLKCLPMPRRIAFATTERLGVMDFGDFGVFTPTNGAVMLAAAVALQPKRLIVAGMDLFQHPAGSYPGDTTTPNAYTVLHDRDTELQFILSRFDRFEGELVILSEVLDGYWRAHDEARLDRAAGAEI